MNIDDKIMASLYARRDMPLLESGPRLGDGIRPGEWQLFVRNIQTKKAFDLSPEYVGMDSYGEYFDAVCKAVGFQVICAIGLIDAGPEAILAFKAKRGEPIQTPMMGF